jgi:hypothetical protein
MPPALKYFGNFSVLKTGNISPGTPAHFTGIRTSSIPHNFYNLPGNNMGNILVKMGNAVKCLKYLFVYKFYPNTAFL